MSNDQTGSDCRSEPIKFWAIIGAGGSGKSSIIRALTGVGNIAREEGGTSRSWRVAYLAGGIQQTFVQGSSLQEVPVSATQFLQNVCKSGSKLVIVALQPRNVADYLELFLENWVCNGLATIGDPIDLVIPGLQIPPLELETRGTTTAANQQAALLRKAWGIL